MLGENLQAIQSRTGQRHLLCSHSKEHFHSTCEVHIEDDRSMRTVYLTFRDKETERHSESASILTHHS
jgi:hypothetical protein